MSMLAKILSLNREMCDNIVYEKEGQAARNKEAPPQGRLIKRRFETGRSIL